MSFDNCPNHFACISSSSITIVSSLSSSHRRPQPLRRHLPGFKSITLIKSTLKQHQPNTGRFLVPCFTLADGHARMRTLKRTCTLSTSLRPHSGYTTLALIRAAFLWNGDDVDVTAAAKAEEAVAMEQPASGEVTAAVSFVASFVEAHSSKHNKGFNCTCRRLPWYGRWPSGGGEPNPGRVRHRLLFHSSSCALGRKRNSEKNNLWVCWGQRRAAAQCGCAVFFPQGHKLAWSHCTPTMGKHANSWSRCSVWHCTHCEREHKGRCTAGVFDHHLIK